MNTYVLLIALVVALGGFVFGVDSGIIATTLGHKTFAVYMYGPIAKNATLTGAIVLVYNAGQAVGTFITGYSADRFSRRWTICAAGMIATFGAALQTAAQNVGMMIAGRLFAGLACGMILSVVPVYIAEVSPPKSRGFIVAILLSIGCFFIPYTPRWLVGKDRYEEAKAVIIRLHGDASEVFLTQEFTQIHDQILLEREGRSANVLVSIKGLFSRRYFRRTATACFILMMGQLSGSTVIQNYQSIFYASVGYTGRTSLLISGIYGFMGVFGQIAYLVFVADKWLRTRTLYKYPSFPRIGSAFLCIMISIIMALSSEFPAGTKDPSGPRAAIAFIFIYSFGYALFFNAMVWVVPVELFPFFLRSKGLGLAVFCKAVVAIVLAQITPIAIQHVGWKYYSLFIASNFVAGGVYYFFLPETKGKSLEEIAELFGDALATEQLEDIDTSGKEGMMVREEASHVEAAKV
ncbi:putative hexose carrier protein [Hyaloscypha variabilis]